MGIRYYAYPVDRDLIELAMRDPEAFLSDDPLADAWGAPEDRPPMLYLDKCWRELQKLFGVDGERPRMSAALVTGDVTHVDMGWIPYVDVLPPELVADIARDMVLVDVDDIDRMFADEETRTYVQEYLAAATEFVTALAARGAGLVYLIG